MIPLCCHPPSFHKPAYQNKITERKSEAVIWETRRKESIVKPEPA
jgi:hypothetical protein